MDKKYFKGTGKLIAFIFRQQRIKIFIWLISIIGITITVAAAYPSIYKDEPSRKAAAMTMDNPAMVAMLGPGYKIEDYVQSIGAMFANEMLLFTSLAVAIMSILLVGRATRGDEEDGRMEMIQALSVGRLSYITAVIIVILLTNITIAILTGIGLIFLDINGIDVEGSLLYGAILGITGFLFASITAVFAQLTETSRGTTMFSFLFLIVGYLIRAIGDVSSDVLSWMSPLGWTVRTGVFIENNWLPVIVALIIAIVLGIFAFYLHSIRDLGSGFIQPRKGKAHASNWLQTSFGLVLRLQRTNIMAWTIGLFALSGSFGAILGDLETYFAEIELMQAYVNVESDYTMTEQFITLLMAIMSLISVVPAVMTVLKLKGEETKNLTENFYTRAVSRSKVLGTYLILAIMVSFLMQTFVALGLWSVSEAVMDEALSFSTTFASAYVYLPAMWVVIGIVLGLLGIVPKLTSLVWLYVVYCFVVVYLSGILDFPQWMNNLSVFEHIPQIPVDDMNWFSITILIVIASILVIIGFRSYNKRDIIG